MVGLGDKRSEKLLRQVRVAQLEALECRARVRIAMDYLRALEDPLAQRRSHAAVKLAHLVPTVPHFACF